MLTPAALLLIAILNLLIAFYVYRTAPLATPARAFAFLALTIAGWTVALAQAHHGTPPTLFFTRLAFAFASLMPAAILCLFRTFPHEPRLTLDALSSLLITASVAFSILSFTPLLVVDAVSSRRLSVEYGPLHLPYAATILASLLWSSWLLLSRFRRATGVVKLQFRYLLLGLLLPGVGVVLTNLVVPLLFHTSTYGQYGPYFALIFLIFTAHALVRYRLMDVRIVLRQSFAHLLSSALATLLLLIVYSLSLVLLGYPPRRSEVVLTLLSIAFLSAFLPPLITAIHRILNAYTFRPPLDHSALLQTASVSLSRTLDLRSLTAFLVPTILHSLQLEHVSFYLHSSPDYNLVESRTHAALRQATIAPTLGPTSPMVHALITTRATLVIDELLLYRRDADPRLLAELAGNKVHVLVPVFSDQNLLAFLALGPKLSSDPFYSTDLTFLSALASHATTAIANSMLYGQVTLANQYLSNILSSMDSAVIAISPNERITLTNRAAEHLIPSLQDHTPPLSASVLPQSLLTPLLATLRDGESRSNLETTLENTRNTLLPVAFSTSALRDTLNRIAGALLVISDLTVPKTLETHTQQTEHLAYLATVAAALAHEIKNPLVAIRTSAELLDDRYTDSDFRAYFTGVVIAEINRIDGLLTKLRTLSLPHSLPMEPIDIRIPLHNTLALLKGHLDRKQLTVASSCDVSLPFVLGNDPQLRQLFLNLLINAISASPVRGVLSISIDTSVKPSPSCLNISITDQGHGIPPSLLPTLFDPFVSATPGGSGLGLALARSIIHAHRGTISASNNSRSAGATLSISLPLCTSSRLQPSPQSQFQIQSALE